MTPLSSPADMLKRCLIITGLVITFLPALPSTRALASTYSTYYYNPSIYGVHPYQVRREMLNIRKERVADRRKDPLWTVLMHPSRADNAVLHPYFRRNPYKPGYVPLDSYLMNQGYKPPYTEYIYAWPAPIDAVCANNTIYRPNGHVAPLNYRCY